MGNYRFRLSEMIPNAWFYKLKYLGSSSNRSRTRSRTHSLFPKPTSTPHHLPTKSNPHSTAAEKTEETPETGETEDAEFHRLTHSRKSYYFTRQLSNQTSPQIQQSPPRKSTKKRTTKHRKSSASPPKSSTGFSVSGVCSCRALPDNHQVPHEDDVALTLDEEFLELDPISHLDLPPIITKPAKFNDMITEIKNRDLTKNPASGSTGNSIRRSFSVNSPVSSGVRLRINSPRIGRRGLGNQSGRRSSVCSSRRRSISESLAIVKSSLDPQKDFRESMVEMIVQNDIRESKDLEELLACYLSLNSDEYHDVIIKVFKQIWFDINQIK